MHAGNHRVNLLARCHMRLVFPHGRRQILLIDQRTDAHHEEFVQIALVNGRKREPFAKGRFAALRFLQHTLIKLEPGKLAVHENRLFIHGYSSVLTLLHRDFLYYNGCVLNPCYFLPDDGKYIIFVSS